MWRQEERNRKRKVKAKIVPTNIFEKYVKCHATGRAVPKFVGAQQSAVPIFNEIKFAQRSSMIPKPDSTWVKELNIFKVGYSEQDLYRIREILEDDGIQTE